MFFIFCGVVVVVVFVLFCMFVNGFVFSFVVFFCLFCFGLISQPNSNFAVNCCRNLQPNSEGGYMQPPFECPPLALFRIWPPNSKEGCMSEVPVEF